MDESARSSEARERTDMDESARSSEARERTAMDYPRRLSRTRRPYFGRSVTEAKGTTRGFGSTST
jgi:hypothetical protein